MKQKKLQLRIDKIIVFTNVDCSTSSGNVDFVQEFITSKLPKRLTVFSGQRSR
jgi:hypothetical protein